MTQCTIDEAKDRYERVITSSLSAVSNLAKVLSLSPDFVLYINTEPELNSESEGLGAVLYGFRNIFSKRFWSDVTTHSNPLIRRASYELISELCTLIPGAIYRNPLSKTELDNTRKSATEKIIPLNKIADIFCQFLNEKSSANIPAMFLAFLSFSKNIPQCWNYISIDQVFVTRIKGLLASHLELTLDHLLPLFGSIPANIMAIFNTKNIDVSTSCLHSKMDWIYIEYLYCISSYFHLFFLINNSFLLFRPLILLILSHICFNFDLIFTHTPISFDTISHIYFPCSFPFLFLFSY